MISLKNYILVLTIFTIPIVAFTIPIGSMSPSAAEEMDYTSVWDMYPYVALPGKCEDLFKAERDVCLLEISAKLRTVEFEIVDEIGRPVRGAKATARTESGEGLALRGAKGPNGNKLRFSFLPGRYGISIYILGKDNTTVWEESLVVDFDEKNESTIRVVVK